jgi:hypothetical protein
MALGNVLDELKVIIDVDMAGLKSGLSAAERVVGKSSDNMVRNLNRVSNVMLGLGTTIIGTLVGATMKWADYADKVEEASQRTGLSIKKIQELSYVADQSGTSIEGIEVSMKNLTRLMGEMTQKTKGATPEMATLEKELEAIEKSEVADQIAEIKRKMSMVDMASKGAGERIANYNAQIEKIKKDYTTSKRVQELNTKLNQLKKEAGQVINPFERLNINVEEFAKLSQDDRLMTILERLSLITDETEREQLAMETLGSKVGTQVLPMIANGYDGLKQKIQSAHDLNLIKTDESIKKGAELQDRINDLKKVFENLFLTIGESTAFKELIQKMTDFILKISEYIEKNPGFIKQVQDFATTFIGLAVALRTATLAMVSFTAFIPGAGWVSALASVAAGVAAFAGINYMFGEIERMPAGKDPRGTPVYGPNGEITAYSKYAQGGIVTGPTMAMIGESGPEAVIPLNQMGGQIQLFIDGEQITDVIEKRMYSRVNSAGGRLYG